jgi:GNAT superfamily N-acetyltransferase
VGGAAGLSVRPAGSGDRRWIGRTLTEAWGSTTVISRGSVHDASRLPALLAVSADALVGLATYRMAGETCELVTIDALRRGEGIGSALLAAVAERAAAQGCRRLWLITTNDNLDALRFYQRRGLRLVAVHRGAVDEARRLKPAIPLVGAHGIPLHDELELELELRPARRPARG